LHPFEEIRAELVRRIVTHEWPIGTDLPTEEVLAAEFDVARGTIRRALKALVEKGLIERRRKAGSRVIARNSHSSTLIIPIVKNEILQRQEEYGYDLLRRRIVTGAKTRFDDFADHRLLHIRSLHLANGRPYQLEDRYISLRTVPDAVEEEFKNVSPNEWLVQRIPLSHIRTVLKALPASSSDSRDLKVKKDSPLFVIERQTHLDGKPVTAVQLKHPGNSFEMVTNTNAFT